MDLHIHAQKKAALLPVGSIKRPQSQFSFLILTLFIHNIIRLSSVTLDRRWWMEIIVAFPFVFHVQLAFNSTLSNHGFAKNHKTFVLECLGRDLKGEQLRQVEVKGGKKKAVLC